MYSRAQYILNCRARDSVRVNAEVAPKPLVLRGDGRLDQIRTDLGEGTRELPLLLVVEKCAQQFAVAIEYLRRRAGIQVAPRFHRPKQPGGKRDARCESGGVKPPLPPPSRVD